MLANPANNITIGNTIPSFKPLSTFSVWRIRNGMEGLLTTACPSAASVGARMAASNAASQIENSGTINLATTAPSKIVSGKPTPSNRNGIRYCLASNRKRILEASVNKTMTSVNSATISRTALASNSLRIPEKKSEITTPIAVKIIGGVINERDT